MSAEAMRVAMSDRYDADEATCPKAVFGGNILVS